MCTSTISYTFQAGFWPRDTVLAFAVFVKIRGLDEEAQQNNGNY